MNTSHGATTPHVSSFFKKYWCAFQEWRKRRRLQTELCRLTDSELMDIGITRSEVDHVALNRFIDSPGIRSTCGGTFFIATLYTACVLLFASEARAQCTARDVLQNQLRLKKAPSASMPQILVRSAVDVPVWKTITVGMFADSFALSNALGAVGCGIGNLAGEILARPAFTLSATKTNVELFVVSAAELGFETDTASQADIYARAQQLGFGLAAAEVAPQLRLQYFDQPAGEFLIVGMEPIKTWNGEPIILTVANGGAGLILIGQDGSTDAQRSVVSRFLFVRSNETALAEVIEQTAALVHH
ncbi:DUF1127 domain-containing protein [Bradyrhizobium sp. CSA112]|uniref:DUF1127 domain-containing protein n=1 Tax=Bradyrhizobium sp. CSA112 TaxID=2699170 RepID=UPI0023AED367|nr:DUF1127 domain-containing protein [Bradyrhizobium sp. CSA112]MDE5454126.1 DUF1127 domain-containing protein [Bradyrhizobium sp. CSA112]